MVDTFLSSLAEAAQTQARTTLVVMYPNDPGNFSPDQKALFEMPIH